MWFLMDAILRAIAWRRYPTHLVVNARNLMAQYIQLTWFLMRAISRRETPVVNLRSLMAQNIQLTWLLMRAISRRRMSI